MEHLDPFREYLLKVAQIVSGSAIKAVLTKEVRPEELAPSAFLVNMRGEILQVNLDIDMSYLEMLPIITSRFTCEGYVALFMAHANPELATTLRVRVNQLVLAIHCVTQWQWGYAEYYPVYILGHDPEVVSGDAPFRFGSRRVQENPFPPEWEGFHVFPPDPPTTVH